MTWLCASISPGTTAAPRRSMTSDARRSSPTSMITPSRTSTALANGTSASSVRTRPFTNATSTADTVSYVRHVLIALAAVLLAAALVYTIHPLHEAVGHALHGDIHGLRTQLLDM